jgi:hypothetical protein
MFEELLRAGPFLGIALQAELDEFLEGLGEVAF